MRERSGLIFCQRLAAIAGAEDELVRVVESFIGLREDFRERPGAAIGVIGICRGKLASERGGEVQSLVAAIGPVTVENVAVFGIGHDRVASPARQVGSQLRKLSVPMRDQVLTRTPPESCCAP